jgi:hypothetical protein
MGGHILFKSETAQCPISSKEKEEEMETIKE